MYSCTGYTKGVIGMTLPVCVRKINSKTYFKKANNTTSYLFKITFNFIRKCPTTAFRLVDAISKTYLSKI